MPIFAYGTKKCETQRILNLFAKPDGNLLPLAIKILDSFINFYGSETNFLESMGEILSLQQTKEAFQSYIEDLGLNDHINLTFSTNTVTPTSITHCIKTGKSIITIG